MGFWGCILGILFIISIVYFSIKKYLNNLKYFFIFKRIIIVSIIVLLIIFIIVESAIIIYGNIHNIEKTDYIIILGAGINGEEMSPALKERMEAALEYLENNDRGEKIIVSGGKGDGENIPEALAMKRYLVSNGVDENRIIMEDKSTNTFENLKFSKEKIVEDSGKRIDSVSTKIVTSDFHCLRSKFLARRTGYSEVYTYSAKFNFCLIPYYIREFFALAKSIIFDR